MQAFYELEDLTIVSGSFRRKLSWVLLNRHQLLVSAIWHRLIGLCNEDVVRYRTFWVWHLLPPRRIIPEFLGRWKRLSGRWLSSSRFVLHRFHGDWNILSCFLYFGKLIFLKGYLIWFPKFRTCTLCKLVYVSMHFGFLQHFATSVNLRMTLISY